MPATHRLWGWEANSALSTRASPCPEGGEVTYIKREKRIKKRNKHISYNLPRDRTLHALAMITHGRGRVQRSGRLRITAITLARTTARPTHAI